MNKQILIVDDEKEIADLVEVYLKGEGYDVLKYYNGKDALEGVETHDVDLAILDVMLPDIDGFKLCQKIRATHFFPYNNAHGENRRNRQDNRDNNWSRRLYHEAV